MVEIRQLRDLQRDDLKVANGYVSAARYRVRKAEIARAVCFTLDRQELSEPYEKRWTVSEEDFQRYGDVVGQGMSFAACDGGCTVGVAIAETRRLEPEPVDPGIRNIEAVPEAGPGPPTDGSCRPACQQGGFPSPGL